MSNFNDIDGPSIEDIKEDLKLNTYMTALIKVGEWENKNNIPKEQRITVYEKVGDKEYPFAVNGKTIEDVIEAYNNLTESAKKYEPKIQNEKLQYRTIVKVKVQDVNDKEEGELYLLCRQYNDNKLTEIENVGLDIILDKSFFEDLVFLNDCEILEFKHIAEVNNITELKEICNKYKLTDIDKCMKGNNLDCAGLLIDQNLEPIGWEEELELEEEEEI